MNKKQRKSAQKRRKIYRELDESMAKGRKFLKKETDKKGNLSQRAKNLQQAIKAARKTGEISKLGVEDIADKLKTLKDGGMAGGDVHPSKKKRGNYGPNIGKPFKAMGPVGGLPVNKSGTKIMAGRLARRGYGKAR